MIKSTGRSENKLTSIEPGTLLISKDLLDERIILLTSHPDEDNKAVGICIYGDSIGAVENWEIDNYTFFRGELILSQ